MRTASLIALLALLLSACQVRVEERIEVSEDGSGSISLVTLFDEEAEEMVTFGLGIDGLESSNDPPGFTTEVVSDGDLQGYAVHAEFADLSQASALANELGDEGGLGAVTLERAEDSIVFRLDLPEEGVGAGTFEATGGFGDVGELTEGLEEFLQVRVVAELPGEIVYTNADSVSGGRAEWEIDPFGTRTQLYATSQPASGFGSPWMWVVVAIGVVLMVAGLVGLQRGRRLEAGATGVPRPGQDELSEAGTGPL